MQNILMAYAQVPAIAREIGYEMKTTFWGDFTVAELLDGEEGVKDTYKRAFNGWKDDKIYATEMNMVLNWKSWQWAEKNQKLSKLYADLYYKMRDYILDNWKGDDLTYYLQTTD